MAPLPWLAGLAAAWRVGALRLDDDHAADPLGAMNNFEREPNEGARTLDPSSKSELMGKGLLKGAASKCGHGKTYKDWDKDGKDGKDKASGDSGDSLALDPMLGGVGTGCVSSVNDEINAALVDIDLRNMRKSIQKQVQDEAKDAKAAAGKADRKIGQIRADALGKMYKADLDQSRRYWESLDLSKAPGSDRAQGAILNIHEKQHDIHLEMVQKATKTAEATIEAQRKKVNRFKAKLDKLKPYTSGLSKSLPKTVGCPESSESPPTLKDSEDPTLKDSEDPFVQKKKGL